MGLSIIWPFRVAIALPLWLAFVATAIISWASRISSSLGIKTLFKTSTWPGWIAKLPEAPMARALSAAFSKRFRSVYSEIVSGITKGSRLVARAA